MLDEFHLNYLAGFKKYRNRSVSMAAKSIINFYREENPKLLNKKHRGRELKLFKEDEMENKIDEYGDQKAYRGIPGAELLGKRKLNGKMVPIDSVEFLSNK